MVKAWTVRNQRNKVTHLRREPKNDSDPGNVLRLLKNNEVVQGDFVFVQRASREVGFIKARHLESQGGGHSMRVRNADGSPTTLLRRQPHESYAESNAAGYAAEGEILSGEFVFVLHKEVKKGGFIKLRHLKPKGDALDVSAALAIWDKAIPVQRWTVLDPAHDGAWLRREPDKDRSAENVVCLVPNGTLVVGEHLLVKRATGEAGFIRFRDLEQQSPRAWIVRNSYDLPKTPLLSTPRMDGQADVEVVAELDQDEKVEGEYVYLTTGKKMGYIKRTYLTALARPPRSEASQPAGRQGAQAAVVNGQVTAGKRPHSLVE